MIQTQSFSINQPTRIVFGVNKVKHLSDLVTELGGNRVFLVADPGLQQAGIINRISAVLDEAKIPYTLYDKVTPEPGLKLADQGLKLAKKMKADCVVGVGGGSALDIAKAISILLTNGGKAEDYLGLGKIKLQGVPKCEPADPVRRVPARFAHAVRALRPSLSGRNNT